MILTTEAPAKPQTKDFDVELLKKSGKGLGLSVVGRRAGAGVFVSDMVGYHMVVRARAVTDLAASTQIEGGLAESSGRIRRGDQILKVDGADLSGARQEEAVAALRGAGPGPIKITFRRGVVE